jgi:hypothetical protein
MRAIQLILLAAVSAVVALVVSYVAIVRPRVKSWGFDPEEAELAFPGDDLVSEPSAIETRGITIDAPPDKVWPWLVQMGFGRGGWYSYGMLDNKGTSADSILPEHQSLQPGDMVKIDKISGFEVKAVEPGRSLVLFTNTELARSQVEKAANEAVGEDQAAASRMSAMMANKSYPDVAASWSFLLQPTDDGKTRLIERFRAQTPDNGPANSFLGEIMGTGIVLLTRKQMIGIKERVERDVYGKSSNSDAVAIPIDASLQSEQLPSLEPEWAAPN